MVHLTPSRTELATLQLADEPVVIGRNKTTKLADPSVSREVAKARATGPNEAVIEVLVGKRVWIVKDSSNATQGAQVLVGPTSAPLKLGDRIFLKDPGDQGLAALHYLVGGDEPGPVAKRRRETGPAPPSPRQSLCQLSDARVVFPAILRPLQPQEKRVREAGAATCPLKDCDLTREGPGGIGTVADWATHVVCMTGVIRELQARRMIEATWAARRPVEMAPFELERGLELDKTRPPLCFVSEGYFPQCFAESRLVSVKRAYLAPAVASALDAMRRERASRTPSPSPSLRATPERIPAGPAGVVGPSNGAGMSAPPPAHAPSTAGPSEAQLPAVPSPALPSPAVPPAVSSGQVGTRTPTAEGQRGDPCQAEAAPGPVPEEQRSAARQLDEFGFLALPEPQWTVESARETMKRIEENYFWGNRVRKIERGARRSGGKPEGGGGGEKLREGAGEARVGGEGDGGPGGEAGAVTGGEGGDGQGGGREGDGAEGEGGALSADEDAWVQRPGDDPPVSPEGEGRPCHHAACQLASVCLITPFFELKDLYPDARTSVNKYKKGSAVRATRTLLKLTKPLRGREDVENLRLGQKTTEKLIEVLETGHMTRLEQLRQKGAPQGGQGRVSPRAEVWGFGEKAAQQLREGHGEGVEAEHLSAVQRLGLRYRHDIAARLPRQKVATIERVLKRELSGLMGPDEAGETHVVTGGSYRRGQESCHDVDCLVLMGLEPKAMAELMEALLHRLVDVGLLTEDSNIEERCAAIRSKVLKTPEHAHEYHFSFMGICRVPSDDLSIDRTAAPASEPLPPAAEPRFGRIDIKFFPRSNGAAGLLYFTGSTSFNIALRHWTYKRMREKAAAEHAPANAYRLTNGVVYPVYIAKSGPWSRRWNDATIVGPPIPGLEYEDDIFRFFGLTYVPPHMRYISSEVPDVPAAGAGASPVARQRPRRVEETGGA